MAVLKELLFSIRRIFFWGPPGTRFTMTWKSRTQILLMMRFRRALDKWGYGAQDAETSFGGKFKKKVTGFCQDTWHYNIKLYIYIYFYIYICWPWPWMSSIYRASVDDQDTVRHPSARPCRICACWLNTLTWTVRANCSLKTLWNWSSRWGHGWPQNM